MEKYNVYGNGEPEKTNFEYEIGEVIMLYTSNDTYPVKCIKKKVIDGKLMQYFKRGIVNYQF